VSQQRANASLHGCYLVSLHLADIPDHSVDSKENHRKSFNSKKINPISGHENLSTCSWEYWRQLTGEKWLFEFSRYSGYILKARTKAKLLRSNFFTILSTKTYSNRFVFDWVTQAITGWRFLKHGVFILLELLLRQFTRYNGLYKGLDRVQAALEVYLVRYLKIVIVYKSCTLLIQSVKTPEYDVQIPLDGPDQTLSGFRRSLMCPRWSPTSPRTLTLSGRVRTSGPCPCSGIRHAPRQTLSLVGSGRVISKFHHTDPRTLSATRPNQTHGQSPYVSRLCGQIYDQTKSADLSETRAVCGSGLVGTAWWNLETTRPDPTSDKVWSGPSSGIWT